MCLEIEASTQLNYFSDQAHVVVLYVYPLSSGRSFAALSPRELIAGKAVSELTEDRRTLEVEPGQQLELGDPLPRDTAELGLVADFYVGARKAMVRAECGFFGGERIVLTANDIQVDP